jgi:predicted phosphohydrolase
MNIFMINKKNKMKIQLTSDLHLEGYSDPIPIVEKYVPADNSDVLILAGDTLPIQYNWEHNPALDYFSKNFKHTILVPGNHEYYKGALLKFEKTNLKLRDNVYLINNDTFELDNVNFVCSTLWSNIIDHFIPYVVHYMYDYKLIKDGNRNNLSALIVKQIHELSKNWIFNEGLKDDMNNIVITHHLPSYQCIHDDFKGSEINSAFASMLDGMIEESNIDYWIYGHTHCGMEDFQIGNTWITANQLGYSHEIDENFKKKNIYV